MYFNNYELYGKNMYKSKIEMTVDLCSRIFYINGTLAEDKIVYGLWADYETNIELVTTRGLLPCMGYYYKGNDSEHADLLGLKILDINNLN